MDEECKYLNECPIFKHIKSEALKNASLLLYCKGSLLKECKRLHLREKNQAVPENLLPTGDSF